MHKLNAIWSLCWALFVIASALAYPRPNSNVVFIMVDDMGWNDVSFHGSDQILTPNIDTLAYQGVILQQYYSEAICTPARTALLTGKYPMRLGMHGSPLFNSEDRGIPLTERLLPSYLKELGYSTHLVGKWHVGMSREEFLPTSRGYESHYGMRGGFIDYYTYTNIEMWPSGRQMLGLDLFDNGIPQNHEERYIVDALTDRAVKIIHQHNTSRPLFLHITHNAPHAGNAGGALQPPLFKTVQSKHIANSNRRLYAEIVTHVDQSIGRIVVALAEKGILDDTIIVFASDNGSPTVGRLQNWGSNLPFRGTKWSPWEGGVRVPAFLWHSSLSPRVWNGLMHITDWLPTLVAAAGGKVTKSIDGVNQWDAILQDGESKRKEVLIALEDSNANMYAAYRAGDYKVIVGNVTGLNNNVYGTELLINKFAPPPYFSTLKSCEVAQMFEYTGRYLDFDVVQNMRQAATVKQIDEIKDATLCIPSLTRGCLFNLRKDPSESHDLWQEANKIAMLLTSRLRGLWAMQLRRGPTNLRNESDPAKFGYTWTPYVKNKDITKVPVQKISNLNLSIDISGNRTSTKDTTKASAVNCDGITGIRNFLCLLQSVF
ncbi:arylsulfatase B [Bombyx mori]|uniref:Sulfatase N-terminal domain-containing protein n=1 Tax=Bombyx mori TaxID=7091 RepID=A0A8R2HP12_BOMMO|nr:arylsulfatase B [Bombyx mori]